jgi:soluble lytic murein transglycosylase-like protein
MNVKMLTCATIFAAFVTADFAIETAKLKPEQKTKLPIFLPMLQGVRIHYPPMSEETYAEKKARLIRKFCGEYDVDVKLVYAMIEQESRHKHSAISPKGAIGYMQLMPSTAKELGVDPKDPFDNLRGGIMYISKQLKKFDGNIELALAAYNAGAGNVYKFGGVPPFKETQKYVKNIVNNMKETV